MPQFLFKSVWHSNILDSTENHNSMFILLQKPLVEQQPFLYIWSNSDLSDSLEYND